MAKKKKTQAKVLSQRMLADGICDLWLETTLAEHVNPGQFVGVYPANAAALLPRPISICRVDEECRDAAAGKQVGKAFGNGARGAGSRGQNFAFAVEQQVNYRQD